MVNDRPSTSIKRVIIESPYAGDDVQIAHNIEYARKCMSDSLRRGEAPFASHLLYTQEGILKDEIPEERALGIAAGLAWGKQADLTAVYIDMGITEGMIYGMDNARQYKRPIVLRSVLRSIGKDEQIYILEKIRNKK